MSPCRRNRGGAARFLLLTAAVLVGIVAGAQTTHAGSQAVVRVYDVQVKGSGTWGTRTLDEETKTWSVRFPRVRVAFNRSGLTATAGGFGGKRTGTETVNVVYSRPPGTTCWETTYTVPAKFSFSGAPYPYGAPNRYEFAVTSDVQPHTPGPGEGCGVYRFQSQGALLKGARVGTKGVVKNGAIGGGGVGVLVKLPRQRAQSLSFPLNRLQAGKAFAFKLAGKFDDPDDPHYAEGTVSVSFTPSR